MPRIAFLYPSSQVFEGPHGTMPIGFLFGDHLLSFNQPCHTSKGEGRALTAHPRGQNPCQLPRGKTPASLGTEDFLGYGLFFSFFISTSIQTG